MQAPSGSEKDDDVPAAVPKHPPEQQHSTPSTSVDEQKKSRKSEPQRNEGIKDAGTWKTGGSNRRKSVVGAQEHVKSRLLELAEIEHEKKIKLICLKENIAKTEHDKKMQIFKLKEEINILKKTKLQREVGIDDFQATRSPLAASNGNALSTDPVLISNLLSCVLRRNMATYAPPTGMPSCTVTSTPAPENATASLPSNAELIWQPFSSD